MTNDYSDFLSGLAEKLDHHELERVKGLYEALEHAQATFVLLDDNLKRLKESTLDIAAEQFRAEIDNEPFVTGADAAATTSSIYDPEEELKTLPAERTGGLIIAEHFTNTNVKQFIEKRLALALTALKNGPSLNEPTTANLSDDQDKEEPAIETVGMYIMDINLLISDIADGAVVIVED